MERQPSRKMKKRCGIALRKLKELECLLHQVMISLSVPNKEFDDNETVESYRCKALLLCDDVDQRSFFLHSLLKAEMASCPSPLSEDCHLTHIERCFELLHQGFHEWIEKGNPTHLLEYLGKSNGPEPECTASCFNDDEEEEEDDIGEVTESVITSTQMSEEEYYYDDVVVVPPVEMMSVGVQTEEEDEELEETEEKSCFSEDDSGETTETLLWNEKAAPPEEEEEEEEEFVSEFMAVVGERETTGMSPKAVAFLIMIVVSAMLMGFMIGRFYYSLNHSAAAATAAAAYSSYYYPFNYYDYRLVRRGGGGGGGHGALNMLPT